MGVRSMITEIPVLNSIQPSDQDKFFANYAQLLVRIAQHEANKVVAGLLVGPPTTPSSQITGAGNTTWLVDLATGIVTVDGIAAEVAETVDVTIHSGSQLGANGTGCIAAIVARNIAGTITIIAVKGTVALTAAVVAPDDGVIQAAVGVGVPWIKLCEARIDRTGDLVVVQSQNNTFRPLFGINLNDGSESLV
jgi:hypothetical protein